MPIQRAADYYLDSKPFMLTRRQDGGRSWQRSGQSDAPSRRSPVDAQYGELPDTLDHPEVWDDLSGGYGYAYRLPDVPNTYDWADGFDARFPGQLIHAQQAALVPATFASYGINVEYIIDGARGAIGQSSKFAASVYASATPSGMQSDIGWTNPNNAMLQDNVYATSALGSAQYSYGLMLTGWGIALPASMNIRGFTVEPRVGDLTASRSVTWHSWLSAAGSLSSVISSPVANLSVNYYQAGTDGTLWGRVWTEADLGASFGVVVKVQNLGIGGGGTALIDAVRLTVYYDAPNSAGAGDVAVLGKNYVARYNVQGEASFSVDRQGSVADAMFGPRPAIFGSFLYVGVGEQSGFHQLGVNDHSVVNTSASVPAGPLVNSGNRMWRAFMAGGPNPKWVRSIPTIDPSAVFSDANWSATLAVGNGYYEIKDMISLGDQVLVGLADGLYAGDQSGTFYNVLGGLSGQIHADNCRDLAIYDGQVLSQAASGVYSYQRTTKETAVVTEVGPTRPSNRSPVRGFVRALKSVGPWLYAGIWNGSASYILAGRNASPGLPFVWHPMQRLPHTARVHRLHIDGITNAQAGGPVSNRFWVATDTSIPVTGTAPLYVWPVPFGNDNPLNAIGFSPNYLGSARMDLGRVNMNAPAVPGVYRTFELTANNLNGSAQYCVVYYTKEDGVRTLLGTARTSPKSTLYFPSGEGSFVIATALQISLESFTASFNVTPVYESFVLRGAVIPKSVDTIVAQTRIADGIKDRRGTPLRSGAVMLEELRAMAATGPQKMQDLSGATQYVKVLAPIEESEVYQLGDEYPEISATVRLAVMSFSAGP